MAGPRPVRTLITKIPLLEVEDVDKTTAWFAKHGNKAVFFGRMVPLFRSFISLPAGTERMNFALFTVLTLTGSLIWNGLFIGAGYLLGANWQRVEPYSAVFQYIVIALVVFFVIRFIVKRIRRTRTA